MMSVQLERGGAKSISVSAKNATNMAKMRAEGGSRPRQGIQSISVVRDQGVIKEGV